jgi:hypothetical protein
VEGLRRELESARSIVQRYLPDAAVLLLDLSRSTSVRGYHPALTQAATALEALTRQHHTATQALYLVPFSYYAREIRPEELPNLNWNEWGSRARASIARLHRAAGGGQPRAVVHTTPERLAADLAEGRSVVDSENAGSP